MPYGSTYNGPGFDSSSNFASAVGGLLEGAERGYRFVTGARDRKKKEDQDAVDEKRRAEASKRQQEEFETRQDEAGYERGGAAAPRVDAMGEGTEDMPGGSITKMAGDLIAGGMRQRPDRWMKTKRSKDERAQESREGTQREVARVRAEAATELEGERQRWRDTNREDQQKAAIALEAERARNRADLVAERLLKGGGDTREDKTIQRAEKALEFAQTRRDRTMTRTPKQGDYLDDVGEVDVPRFEAAKAGFTSDSTMVEGEVSRRERAYSKAIGEPAEPGDLEFDRSPIAKARAKSEWEQMNARVQGAQGRAAPAAKKVEAAGTAPDTSEFAGMRAWAEKNPPKAGETREAYKARYAASKR